MARLLVVEDAEPIRELVLDSLPEHEIDCAQDGCEGLRRLETVDYDLLVVNYRMPRMDGVRMLAAARGRLRGRVPVILRTCDPSFPDAPEQMQGVDRLLRTEFSPTTLREAVGDLLEYRMARLSRVVRLADRGGGHAFRAEARRRHVASTSRLPDRRAIAEAQLLALWAACGGQAVREILWCASPREALHVVSAGLRRLGPWAFRSAGLPASLSWTPPGGVRGGLPWRLPEGDLRAAIRDQLVAEARAVGDGEHCLALLGCLLAVPGAILTDDEGVVGRWADWHWFVSDWMAVVSEPPVAVHRDPAGRLHHETGPTIEYADGFGVHLREGRRVPVPPLAPAAPARPLRGVPSPEGGA